MKKKVKARHQIEKVTITFIPNEENIEKAAEVYAKAVIKMVKIKLILINNNNLWSVFVGRLRR